jgi:hypothetical protein
MGYAIPLSFCGGFAFFPAKSVIASAIFPVP